MEQAMTDPTITPERLAALERGIDDRFTWDELKLHAKDLVVALRASQARESALIDLLRHQQWDVISGAIDNYSAGKTSDLAALGIAGQGFLVLNEARKAALTPRDQKDSR
jgi:hypothetical protein